MLSMLLFDNVISSPLPAREISPNGHVKLWFGHIKADKRQRNRYLKVVDDSVRLINFILGLFTVSPEAPGHDAAVTTFSGFRIFLPKCVSFWGIQRHQSKKITGQKGKTMKLGNIRNDLPENQYILCYSSYAYKTPKPLKGYRILPILSIGSVICRSGFTPCFPLSA